MKKTILFHVHNLLAGGIEKVLIDLLQALDPQRYRVILSIAHHFGEKEVLKPQVPAHVEVRYIVDKAWLNYAKKQKMTGKLSLPVKALSELVVPFFVKRLHRQKLAAWSKEVDVIVDFDMTLSSYHAAMGATRKVAYCHFSFAHYWNGNRRKLDKLAGRLARYDRVVMLCDEMKEDAAAMYPFLAPKLVRLYNALNLERIRVLGQAHLPSEYGYLEEKGFLLSVGRLQASQKDFATVVRAYAAAVRSAGIAEWLVIAGDGSAKEPLQELARAEGVGDRVVFVGFQSNPFQWMANCRLFLFGSKYEGLPTVLIEAQSLHCPIIATACKTGVRELLLHGKAGTLVEVGDHAAMGLAIPEVLNNGQLRASWSEAAAPFLKLFDISYMIGEFERIVIAPSDSPQGGTVL